MLSDFCLTSCFLILNGVAASYKTYTALDSVIFTNIDRTSDLTIHSEYFFGRCATRHKILLEKKKYNSDDIRGNLIVRGWLNTTLEPTCVYVRAKSKYGHIVRYKPMMFSMCICRIVYHYEGIIYYHHFFEWYIPIDMKPGITWDLYFYKLYTGTHKEISGRRSIGHKRFV